MKFSIRDLMLVTIIVAVCTAWWLDRTRLDGENRQLKKSLETRPFVTISRNVIGHQHGVWLGDY